MTESEASAVSPWRFRVSDNKGALKEIVSHLFFALFILIACFRGLLLSGMVWRKFLPFLIQNLTSGRCRLCFVMKLEKR